VNGVNFGVKYRSIVLCFIQAPGKPGALFFIHVVLDYPRRKYTGKEIPFMGKILIGFVLQGIYFELLLAFPKERELPVILAAGAILIAALWLPGIALLLKGIKQYFFDDILAELKKINQSATAKQFLMLFFIALFLPNYIYAAQTKSSNSKIPSGKWELFQRIDPLDDSKSVGLSIESYQGINKFGRPMTLVIRCKGKEPDIYIVWGEYIGQERAFVTARFDSEQAEEDEWNISSAHDTTFYKKDVHEFLSRMKESTTFVASIYPYEEDRRVAVFNTSLLKKSLSEFYKQCPAPVIITYTPEEQKKQAIEKCKEKITEYISEKGEPLSTSGKLDDGETILRFKDGSGVTFNLSIPVSHRGFGACNVFFND